MANLTDIRQRADRGLASVQDIQALLAHIDTITQNERIVLVPDPDAVAKAVVQVRAEQIAAAAAAQAATDTQLRVQAELRAAQATLSRAEFDSQAVQRAQVAVDEAQQKVKES